MIKCPFCHTNHVDNTVFCSECGTYLLEDEQTETDQLDQQEMGWVGDTADGSETTPSLQPGPQPVAIRLDIGPGKREIEVKLDKIIHMGRVDPASNVFPEIDLSDNGSSTKRISRRHARILKQGDTVVIEDTGSINGTFINGKRLDPYVPEILNDGDTLQFGILLVEVKILKR